MTYGRVSSFWYQQHRLFTQAIQGFATQRNNNQLRKPHFTEIHSTLNELEKLLRFKKSTDEETPHPQLRSKRNILKQIFLSILFFCGFIHAISAAFDGINTLFGIFMLPNIFISVGCTILATVSFCLFFAYEVTRLTRGLGVENFIQMNSAPRDLLKIQKKIRRIKSLLEARMQESLIQNNLEHFAGYRRIYLDLHLHLKPLSQLITQYKTEEESTSRKVLKHTLSFMAGLLSGAVAFFDGQSLLTVASTLFTITIPSGVMFWLPLTIGSFCFVAIMTIALFSEGAGILTLIDEFQKKPYYVIHKELDLNEWQIPHYQKVLMRIKAVRKPQVIILERTTNFNLLTIEPKPDPELEAAATSTYPEAAATNTYELRGI